MTDQTQAQQAQQAQQAPSLGLEDLATSIQIIDICSKRGAFEGAELESVGALRNRLVAFVKSQQPDEEAEQEEVTEEAGE